MIVAEADGRFLPVGMAIKFVGRQYNPRRQQSILQRYSVDGEARPAHEAAFVVVGESQNWSDDERAPPDLSP
jgi:hypothetical protein